MTLAMSTGSESSASMTQPELQTAQDAGMRRCWGCHTLNTVSEQEWSIVKVDQAGDFWVRSTRVADDSRRFCSVAGAAAYFLREAQGKKVLQSACSKDRETLLVNSVLLS